MDKLKKLAIYAALGGVGIFLGNVMVGLWQVPGWCALIFVIYSEFADHRFDLFIIGVIFELFGVFLGTIIVKKWWGPFFGGLTFGFLSMLVFLAFIIAD